MRNTYLIAALASVIGMGVLTGCSQEAREKYDAAGENASQATKQTGDAIATDAAKSGEAVEKTAEAGAQAVKNVGENTKKAVDNGQTTLAVKNALLTAHDLSTKDLNVDTIDNKVVLRGSVPTADQKKRAEDIAKGIAGNMTVENQLTVSGGQ